MQTTLNFATRPFRDERPVFVVAGFALAAAAILLVANCRLYTEFHRTMGGTSRQIETLVARRAAAARGAEQARAALNSYRVSNLAQESRGLLQVVAARRFSWTGLLARLEHVLPADVRVSRLTPTFAEGGEVNLSLSLVGQGADSVVRTIAALSRDTAFSRVDLHSEASQERGVPEGHSFELVVRYLPEARR
jgi:Tfp pilus assembly protein PilN